MLPLAAATADIPRFPVNLVYIHKGRVKRSCPLIAEILLKQETKSRITISGRIMDLPNDVHKSDLLVFWPDYAGRPLQPFSLNWNPSGADFFITFAQVRRRSDTWADTPAMALVCDSGKGK